MYQWDENRTDWLRGATLQAPPSQLQLGPIPTYRLSLDAQQREYLRLWVYVYYLWQAAAMERISAVMLHNMRSVLPELLGTVPRIIHNSRIGRENLTLASLKLARWLAVPFVLTPNHHSRWQGWCYRHYHQLYRESDAITVYTEFERKELIKLGVAPHKIHRSIIAPLLAKNSSGQRFRESYSIPAEAPVILFIGQKYAYKGFDQILKAAATIWKTHPDAHFVFIGARTPYSQRVFPAYADQRIIELGVVDLQVKTDALAACRFLCVPSAQESFGGVYLEAWQLGKPVIVGPAPAVQEIISDGINGFTARNQTELIQHMRYLLDHQLTITTTADAYTWDKAAEIIYALYQQLNPL